MSETPSPAVTPPSIPRQSRARFWLRLALVLLGVLPLLAWLIAWACINGGALDSTISERLSKKFGTPAQVGSVKTEVLRNLTFKNIRVEPKGDGEPLTVESVRLDFQTIDFLTTGRVRSAIIDRPKIDLRFDPAKGWNHALKPSPETEGGGAPLDSLVIGNGSISVAWLGGGHINLKNLDATYRGVVGDLNLNGVLESGETFSLNGDCQRDGALRAKLIGDLNLAVDGAAMMGGRPDFTGKLEYEFNAKRGASFKLNGARAPVSIDGSISLKHAACLSLGRTFKDEAFTSKVSVGVIASNVAFKTIDIQGIHLSLGSIGELSSNARISTEAGSRVRLAKTAARIDIGALDAALKPGLLGDGASVSGELRLGEFSASFSPTDSAVAPTLDGPVELRDIRIAFKDWGTLPPLNARAKFDGGSLRDGRIQLGDAAMLSFEIDGFNPLARVPFDASRVRIGGLRFDFGRFFDSVTNRPAAPAFALNGAIVGERIETLRTEDEQGGSRVRISGLELKGFAPKAWPLSASIPEMQFSGPLSGSIDFKNGQPMVAVFTGALIGRDKRDSTFSQITGAIFGGATPTAAATIRAEFRRDADGPWHVHALGADRVSFPLALLGQMFDLPKRAGVSLSGMLTKSNIHSESETGTTTGTLAIEGGEARFRLPENVRRSMSEMLFQMNKKFAAIAADVGGQVGVMGVRGEMTFELAHGTLRLKGHAAPFKFLGNALGIAETSVASGFETDVDFTGEFDWLNQVAGPFTLATQRFRLPPLGTLNDPVSGMAQNAFEGDLQNVSVHIERFSTAPGAPVERTISVRFGSSALGPLTLRAQELRFDLSETSMTLSTPLTIVGPCCGATLGPVVIESGKKPGDSRRTTLHMERWIRVLGTEYRWTWQTSE